MASPYDDNAMTELTLGTITVDLAAAQVIRDGAVLPLAPKERDILSLLAMRPNQDVTREELYQRVWGYDAGVVTRTLDTTVHRLRTKIEVTPSNPVHLRTVHGFGYRLVLSAPDDQEPTLVGRRDELAFLADQHGAVLISGPMGIGKTALAHAAVENEPQHDWLDATGHDDAEVARAIERSSASVIVVDNLGSVGPMVGRVARQRGKRVLLLSRSTSGWRGPTLPLGPLAAPEAAQLLSLCVSRSGHDAAPASDTLHRMGMCADGVPALLVALSDSLPLLGEEALVQRLCNPTSFQEACPCEQLVERLADSWAELLPEQRALLTLVSWLGEDVDLHLIEALHEGSTTAQLTELYRDSWLAPARTDGRIRMYRHMRACCIGLSGREANDAVKERAVAWSHRCAQELEGTPDTTGPRAPTMAEGFRRIFAEDDIVVDETWRTAYDRLLSEFGTTREHQAFLDDCLTVPGVSAAARAHWLLARATIGVHHRRTSVLEDTASVLSGTNVEPPSLAEAWSIRSVFLQQGGQTAQAEDALRSLEAVVADRFELRPLVGLARGQVHYCRGELEQARAALQEAQTLALGAGQLHVARRVMVKLAVVMADELDLVSAALVLDQTRRLGLPRGGRALVAFTMLEARIAMLQGDLAASRIHHERCSEQAKACELHGARSLCETSLAWLDLAEGDADAALPHAVQSLDLWGQHRNPLWLGSANIAMAMVHLQADEAPVGESLLRMAVVHLEIDQRNEMMARCLLAYALQRMGNAQAAEEQLAIAAGWSRAHDDRLAEVATRSFQRLLRDGDPSFEGVPEPYRSAFRHLPID